MKKLFIAIVLASVGSTAMAERYYEHEHDYEQVTNVTNTTNVNVDENDYQAGTAVGLAASALHFDHDTTRLQAGVGASRFEGENAASIGVAQRIMLNSAHRPLLSGTVATSNGGTGGSVGISFQF